MPIVKPDIDEYVRRLVDTAPPLTEAQRAQLRQLLRRDCGHQPSTKPASLRRAS